MWRYLVDGVAAIMMVAAGWLLFNGRARSDPILPAQPQQAVGSGASEDNSPLPAAPEASDKTREQKRFDRYDKDRNGAITREEYLMQRRKAYARLDTNHDGALSFDEWSAKTIAKFTVADRDKSGGMSTSEFATTAVKRVARPRCACPQAKPSGEEE